MHGRAPACVPPAELMRNQKSKYINGLYEPSAELNGREHEKHYEHEIRGAVYGTAQSKLCARAFKLVFQPRYDRRGEEHREDQRDKEYGAYA